MNAPELRLKYKGLRDAINSQERARKTLEIGKRLAALAAFKSASQALFYVSTGSEVDTVPLRSMARDLGLGVSVPRSDTTTKRLVFHDLDSDLKLEPGPFGIAQPKPDSRVTDLTNKSVVLVPGMVFDVLGHRLGWGGGYYDRFLGGDGAGLVSVGLAFDIQISDNLPQQAHDVALRWIVTESRVIDCSAPNKGRP
ncbi:MAG: 5-formyltetrahydrofolate cyclo-ligase [candidate division FCPU426 bacterium]